jgi:transcriptional regulator with XRE-family HTH domain
MMMTQPPVNWQIAQPREVRQETGRWLRAARQRQNMTLPMLASASGVPVTTLHRLEREGQGGVDSLLRALHALGLLDDFQSFIRGRLRLAELPTDLSELDRPVRVRQRVRVAKSTQGVP